MEKSHALVSNAVASNPGVPSSAGSGVTYPLINPLVLSVRPGGNSPPDILHVSVVPGSSSVAVSCMLMTSPSNTASKAAGGSVSITGSSGPVTVILNTRSATLPSALVALTVN